MEAFTQLTDDIILFILYPTTGSTANIKPQSDGLTTAREILNNIFKRKLYKFVSQTQVKVSMQKIVKTDPSFPKADCVCLTIIVRCSLSIA